MTLINIHYLRVAKETLDGGLIDSVLDQAPKNFQDQLKHVDRRHRHAPLRSCEYRMKPEGDNRFWTIEFPWGGKDEICVGPAELVAQNVYYDNSDRLALHHEITVGEALRYRGDISMNETIMLFRLPQNRRGVQVVAYTSQHIMVTHP